MAERRIDLNLINVFCAVMAESSVTRAASRLSMSQPAVSNALRRLRYLFQDELFLKVPSGIRPTEKAVAIWPELQQGLDRIRAIAEPRSFDPAATKMTFNLAVTDTLAARVIPALAAEFIALAPSAKLHFQLHSNPVSNAALEKGALDCALGMFPTTPERILTDSVMVDDYVCVFRRGHPLLGMSFTLENYLLARHLLVKQASWQIGIVDAWLNLVAAQRNIVMIVNDSTQALQIVRRSDLVAVMPLRFMGGIGSELGVEVAPLPIERSRIQYKIAWHERTTRDPARTWLRSLLRRVVETCYA